MASQYLQYDMCKANGVELSFILHTAECFFHLMNDRYPGIERDTSLTTAPGGSSALSHAITVNSAPESSPLNGNKRSIVQQVDIMTDRRSPRTLLQRPLTKPAVLSGRLWHVAATPSPTDNSGYIATHLPYIGSSWIRPS
jgi:hypothetical protein